jgi:hypothetical protein
MPDTHAPSATLVKAEAEDYMRAAFATVNVLAAAFVSLDAIARSGTSQGERDEARAKALKVMRELELVNANITAFVNGTASVRPPTLDEIQTTQDLATKLSTDIAAQAKVAAIFNIVTKALTVFNGLHR